MHRLAYILPIIAMSVLAGCNRPPPPEVWPPPTAQACLDGHPARHSLGGDLGSAPPARIAAQDRNHRQTSRTLHLYACFLRRYDLDARITISAEPLVTSAEPIVTRISPETQDIPGKAGQAVMVPVTATLEGDDDTFITMHVTTLPGGGKTYETYGYSLKVLAHGHDVHLVE
jgi:hypothetical protein